MLIYNIMSCYRATNNKYKSSPALMADGRGFTDYRSSRQTNDMLRSDMNVINSHNYRAFLIKNTDKLLETDRINANLMNGSTKCVSPYNQGTMLPEKFIQTCDKKSCTYILNNENGVGTGRYYNTSTDCNLEFSNKDSKCMNNLNNLY